MDRSIPGLPDATARRARRERRACARQKLHTPVYARFRGAAAGAADLSELLDLNDEGFAVQTSAALEVDRTISVCLELLETKRSISGDGRVMWSDAAGRGGIKFLSLPESARAALQEWLSINLQMAGVNGAARNEDVARLGQWQPAAEGLDAKACLEVVRSALGKIREDGAAVLQHIADSALILTGADGAAVALFAGETMVCRARAGEPAPALGAAVAVEHGLSGECVRSGRLVSCDDTESDPRVVAEVCRALGVRSFLAAPVFADFRVMGLLEVFSARPRKFTPPHGSLLTALADLVPREQCAPPVAVAAATLDPAQDSVAPHTAKSAASAFDLAPELATMRAHIEPYVEAEPESPRLEAARGGQDAALSVSSVAPSRAPFGPPSDSRRNWPAMVTRLRGQALLGLSLVVVAVAIGYLAGPWVEKRWIASPLAAQPLRTASSRRAANDGLAQAKSLPDLQALASAGDAEAQWQMGMRYHEGEGVPQDDAIATNWFELAAEQGQVDAQSHLGAYYWAGRGVRSDLSKAYFWSAIAMAQGDEISKARLEGLTSQMTRAEVSAASQRAQAWISQQNSGKRRGQ